MNSEFQAAQTACQHPLSSGTVAEQARVISKAVTIADAFPILVEPLTAQVEARTRAFRENVDSESLHKLRVALRRLRTLWWAYEPYLDKAAAKAHRREFKLLADAAGHTRNWDVLRSVLSVENSTEHSFTRLLEKVDECRKCSLTASRAIIESVDLDQLLGIQVESSRVRLHSQAYDEPLTAFAARRIAAAERSLNKRVQRARAHQNPEYAELHQLRIAGKKLRYMLEFFVPILDDCDSSSIQSLAALQDELGALNDYVTSEALLQGHVNELGEEADFERAVYLVTEQKVRRMQHAYKLLHTIDDTLARKPPTCSALALR